MNSVNKIMLVVSLLIGLIFGLTNAAVLLTTEDAQVDSWNNHSGVSTVLAAGDGAYGSERIWHTFMKFDLPALDVGESFTSAELRIYVDNYWSWTVPAADVYSSVAAFRVWETVNSWEPNTVTWATQPTKFQLPVWPLVDEGDLLDTQFLGYGNNMIYVWAGFNVFEAMESGATISLAMDCNRDAVGGSSGGGIWFHSYEQGMGPRIQYDVAFDTNLVDSIVEPVQDCYVDSWNPTTVYNGIDLVVGNYEDGRGRAALLRFTLPTLQAGEDFHNAYLSLYQEGSGGDVNIPVNFRISDVNGTWNETTCTYNNMPDANTLVGTLQTISTKNGQRIRAKVLDAVKNAGSGGTVNLMIYWDANDNGTNKYVGTWKSREIGDAALRPKLELVLNLPEVCNPGLQADITGDCKVNLADFAIMASEWLNCNWNKPELCQ